MTIQEPVCLSCLKQGTRRSHVLCKPCFNENRESFAKLDGDFPSVAKVRKMLWGQRFAKNQLPHIRARIAYVSHVLAQEGEDHLLETVRNTLLRQTGDRGTTEVIHPEPSLEAERLESELSALEQALDPVYRPNIDRPGEHRTKDGHFVRSKSEVAIANFLFDNRICYQYERRIFLGDQELHPDFFLPDHDVYIEHFGLLDNPNYKKYATKKADLYKEHNVQLIATDEDAFKREGVESMLYRRLRGNVPSLKAPS